MPYEYKIYIQLTKRAKYFKNWKILILNSIFISIFFWLKWYTKTPFFNINILQSTLYTFVNYKVGMNIE